MQHINTQNLSQNNINLMECIIKIQAHIGLEILLNMSHKTISKISSNNIDEFIGWIYFKNYMNVHFNLLSKKDSRFFDYNYTNNTQKDIQRIIIEKDSTLKKQNDTSNNIFHTILFHEFIHYFMHVIPFEISIDQEKNEIQISSDGSGSFSGKHYDFSTKNKNASMNKILKHLIEKGIFAISSMIAENIFLKNNSIQSYQINFDSNSFNDHISFNMIIEEIMTLFNLKEDRLYKIKIKENIKTIILNNTVSFFLENKDFFNFYYNYLKDFANTHNIPHILSNKIATTPINHKYYKISSEKINQETILTIIVVKKFLNHIIQKSSFNITNKYHAMIKNIKKDISNMIKNQHYDIIDHAKI